MGIASSTLKSKLTNSAWDAFCIASLVGIWPRYIEPRLIDSSHLDLHFPHLTFDKIKIIQFSDLHLNKSTSKRFLKKLIRKKNAFDPDFTLFTGDFFCRSEFVRQELLIDLFHEMKGKSGSFCCFGNHDYTPYLTLCDGQIITKKRKTPPLLSGIKRLVKKPPAYTHPNLSPCLPTPKVAEPILELLKHTPFTPLHNDKVCLDWEGTKIHFAGLGDFWSGLFKPQDSLFKASDDELCITLSHNPDSFVELKNYPIDLILSGHTHGRQVNLPFIGRKLTPMINSSWARGEYSEGSTKMYVNRGLGGQTNFRWFSKPECTQITLTGNLSK